MKRFIFLSMLFFSITQIHSQIDTVSFEKSILNIDQFSMGSSNYLHYRQDTFSNAPMYDISIWQRHTQIQGDNIIFDWKWIMPDSASYTDKKITVNASNLRPINIAWTTYLKGVPGYSFAFNFNPKSLQSDPDTTKHNYQAIQMPYDYLGYCWDMDLETFGMLPLKVGKTFALPFYETGGDPPAYYNYEVIRKEKINFASGLIDTYVLRHYHPDNKLEFTEWWIDEKSFNVIKMKSTYGTTYRYKLLLPK